MAGFGNCPVCKKPLSVEMLPIGWGPSDRKGNQKPKINLSIILPQVINYTIDTSIRASIGSGRSLYYFCGNEECPVCYSPAKPFYFKRDVIGQFVLVGDPLGFMLMSLQNQYRKKKKK